MVSFKVTYRGERRSVCDLCVSCSELYTEYVSITLNRLHCICGCMFSTNKNQDLFPPETLSPSFRIAS